MLVLLGWTVKNTVTLLKIYPVEFRVLSEALLRFQGSQFEFRCNQSVFPGGSDFGLLVRTEARKLRIFADIWKKTAVSSELATWTVTGLWRHGKLLHKAPGKLRGASWRVYGCF